MAYLKHGQLSTKPNGTRDGETVRDGVSVSWFDSKRETQSEKESEMETEKESETKSVT